MPLPPLNEVAGRIPQRWRRRVPTGLRNRIVERVGHPKEPFDPARFPRRVNLGCGFDVRAGWLNVDFHGFHGPDLVADVRSLPMLPSGAYDEVLAQDVLEHLGREESLPALREWRRLLRDGGRIALRVPDVPAVGRWITQADDADHHRRVLQFLFGTQAYDGDFHHNGFTDVLLCDELFKAGFGDVRMWIKDGWMWEVTAVAGAPRIGLAYGPGFEEPEEGWHRVEEEAELALHVAEPATVELRLLTDAGEDARTLAVQRTARERVGGPADVRAMATLIGSAPAEPAPAPAAPVRPSYPRDREGLDNLHLELALGWLLREDSNCIDVGANEGRFLWHILRRAPRGRHFAFEPIPALAARLREQFPQVEVHEAAVADRAGTAEFVVVPEDLGYSGLRERQYPQAWATERIEVAIARLDDVLPDGYAPDFLKVDVEGGELQVFQGAIETLRRHRPVIVFEHGPGAADRYGTTPEQVWDLLAGELGMRIFDMDAEGPLSRERLAELFAAGERWNFLALP